MERVNQSDELTEMALASQQDAFQESWSKGQGIVYRDPEFPGKLVQEFGDGTRFIVEIAEDKKSFVKVQQIESVTSV